MLKSFKYSGFWLSNWDSNKHYQKFLREKEFLIVSMIDFTNTEMAVAVIFTLIIMFVISFAVSFLFWLIYHQNMKKVDYRMKLATQLVVNKKRHSA
ncbi:hypothetical protein HMPREF0538_21516 [Limosilactobacillus reuteri SD2112]|uniref:Uncharacterized protein n=1 Tax=Limosilactobacillus reuteri (strain ATCC 55730 / SD2112) TaxID=491077 RepID=F8DLI5_LIMRS|nr:hypothetical protein HMPREF0538_21516 [Limosilactobacillus reuteri SD2112]